MYTKIQNFVGKKLSFAIFYEFKVKMKLTLTLTWNDLYV